MGISRIGFVKIAAAVGLCMTMVQSVRAQEIAPPVAPTPESIAPPVAPPVAPPAMVAPSPAMVAPPISVAGYSNGTFYIRDPKEWFVLFPKARLHIDWYNFLNRGDAPSGVEPNSTKDPRPRMTLFVRRARLELQGTAFGHFDFHIAGEFASVPGTGATGVVADAYVIVDYLSFLKLQVGQFDAPFTMENRTSDKWIDFMERSLAVRAFGVPSNKEMGGMLFGWLPKKVAYYSLGVFNGDGQNFKNQDNQVAVLARAFVAPLAWMPLAQKYPWLQNIWVGGSFWWQRAGNLGASAAANVTGAAQDDLTAMTTQGGFSFFSTNYANGTDGSGNAIRSHLAPYGDIVKWAVEANVPFWKKMGARFELVHQSLDLAQYNDTNPALATLTRSSAIRGGNLDGFAYYLELYGWILGDNSFIETPGLETAPRLARYPVNKDPRWGLMVAAKYEHLQFDISGLANQMGAMGASSVNPAQGHYSVDAFELGVNAWATKHVRMTVNYVLNFIDGNSVQATKNFYHDQKEHELLLRLALAL